MMNYPYLGGYPMLPQQQPMIPQQQSILPAQQILKANGKASVDAVKMLPNSSVLIMDTTAPIVWMCVSDSLGNVTSTPYDVAPHKEQEPQTSLEDRLAAVEDSVNNILTRLEETENAKSNVGNVKQKQAGKSDGSN